MITYLGRDKATNVVRFERDGVPMELPQSFIDRPSNMLKASIRCHSYAAFLIQSWGHQPKRKWCRLVGDSWFGNHNGLVRKGYSISDEQELAMKEQAVALLVAQQLQGQGAITPCATM